jgi:hypothetical protein
MCEAFMTVGQVILKQLGGGKFMAMTGAHSLMGMDDGLSLKLPSNFATGGINYIRIKLNVRDTYDVEFGKTRGMKYTQISSQEGVYNDNLRDVVSDTTGLALSLGNMGRPASRSTEIEGELFQ